MAVDFKTFLQRLFDSGILTEQNFNALEQKKIRHQNVESFIQDLIESKLLTKFQAEQIIAGKGESLSFWQVHHSRKTWSRWYGAGL